MKIERERERKSNTDRQIQLKEMEIEIEVGIECNLRFEKHERKNGREIKFKYNQKLNKCN